MNLFNFNLESKEGEEEAGFDFGTIPEGNEPDFDFGFGSDFETRYINPPQIREVPERFMKYAKAENLAREIKVSKGSRAFAIIDGGFIFGDFIEALIVENDWLVKSMTISTLSLSQNNVDSLENLIRGDYVQELNLIVSAYFFAHERQGLVKYLYERLDIDNKFQLAVAGTHCKTTFFETDGGLFVGIHGSANLRSSANIEQIVIEENEALYRFNKEYQDRIISKYLTIKKTNSRFKTMANGSTSKGGGGVRNGRTTAAARRNPVRGIGSGPAFDPVAGF